MKLFKRSLKTEKGNISYYLSACSKADAPWLIFLPGLTADHRLFKKQLAYFGEEYRCLTWDAPGHYQSRPFELSFSMADIVAYLYQIMKNEEISHPVLIGQSFGGYISQAFIEKYPSAIAGIVSIDSAPLKRNYYQNWELYALKHTKLMYLSIPWQMLIRWGAWGTAETPYGQKLMKTMMQAYKKGEYCSLTAYGYRLLADAVEAEKEYEIPCPLLVLCGEKDKADSTKRYNAAWAREEKVNLHWIIGAGHNSNTDCPETVNREIERFLQTKVFEKKENHL